MQLQSGGGGVQVLEEDPRSAVHSPTAAPEEGPFPRSPPANQAAHSGGADPPIVTATLPASLKRECCVLLGASSACGRLHLW